MLNALYDILSADSSITSALGTHNGVTSIFTVNPVPPKAPRPYIFMFTTDDVDIPDKTKIRREKQATVVIVSDNSGSRVSQNSLAKLVRKAIHQQPLSIDGETSYITNADGPAEFPSDHTVYADSVEVTALVEEN